MLTLQELREYLEKEREDLVELREKSDLSNEGEGQLQIINAIFEKMGWKEKGDQDIKEESDDIKEKEN